MTKWQPPRREPPKTKAELYEMLAEAVRNTAQPEPKRPPKAKRRLRARQDGPPFHSLMRRRLGASRIELLSNYKGCSVYYHRAVSASIDECELDNARA